jgi:hypothetical protein
LITRRFEIFASGPAEPDQVWALVGNPRRLPEWTDVEGVERVDAEPIEVGSQLVVRYAGQISTWEVTTFQPRLLEAVTSLERGRLGIGVRVLADPVGSRVVLAAAFAAADRMAAAGFLLLAGPRLRRRFDRWSQGAVGARIERG